MPKSEYGTMSSTDEIFGPVLGGSAVAQPLSSKKNPIWDEGHYARQLFLSGTIRMIGARTISKFAGITPRNASLFVRSKTIWPLQITTLPPRHCGPSRLDVPLLCVWRRKFS
jgi:hypothetical protein